MEAIVFLIIAGLISMFFNKKKNKEEPNTVFRKINEQAEEGEKQTEKPPVPVSVLKSAPAQKLNVQPKPKPAFSRKQLSPPIKGIHEWSEKDFLKSIILSEVLGPPKSKRKK